MKHQCKEISHLKFDLGEGLIWDDSTSSLLMTDIMKGQLIKLDITSNTHRYWHFNEPLSWVLPTTVKGKYLLGLKSGIAFLNMTKPGDLVWVSTDFPKASDCRLNDACTDSTGRVWYGSMNMATPSSKDGQLASFSEKEGLKIHDHGFTVTNGPVISPDGKSLFLSDTMQGLVYRYQLNISSGKLSRRRIFARFMPDQGYPDGMCFDANGNLWIALWGGASIVQLDTSGKLLEKISIPALNVTNLCFCGPHLDRLIVSSAAIGLSKQEMKRYPASGALFEITHHHSSGIEHYPVTLGSLWT
jgi:D-xylonolactonase